jgi:hypothetical protein
MLANEERSSLVYHMNSNEENKFDKINIRTQCYKTFYSRNLQLFIKNWSVFLWQASQPSLTSAS